MMMLLEVVYSSTVEYVFICIVQIPNLATTCIGAVHKWRHTILGKNLPPPLSHFVTSI